MSAWNYQREENERGVAGKYRCVITAAEDTVSKTSGKPMIVVTVRPSGYRITVKHYIVQNENFNKNMTQFFDAFPEIEEGNFEFLTWVGAEGAAAFKEDEKGYLKVGYWLSPERAANLPAFEGDKPERQEITSFTDDDGDDLPFD